MNWFDWLLAVVVFAHVIAIIVVRECYVGKDWFREFLSIHPITQTILALGFLVFEFEWEKAIIKKVAIYVLTIAVIICGFYFLSWWVMVISLFTVYFAIAVFHLLVRKTIRKGVPGIFMPGEVVIGTLMLIIVAVLIITRNNEYSKRFHKSIFALGF